jgi:hypothetical protein
MHEDACKSCLHRAVRLIIFVCWFCSVNFLFSWRPIFDSFLLIILPLPRWLQINQMYFKYFFVSQERDILKSGSTCHISHNLKIFTKVIRYFSGSAFNIAAPYNYNFLWSCRLFRFRFSYLCVMCQTLKMKCCLFTVEVM